MVSISDEEFSLDVLDALGELGRNVLAGRAVLPAHPLHNSPVTHNVSAFYVTIVV